GWQNVFQRPARLPLDSGRVPRAVRETPQSPEVARFVPDATGPPADRVHDAAIDEDIHDPIVTDPPTSPEELVVLEPEQSEAPEVKHRESGVPAFDTIHTVSIATPERAERRWSEAAFGIWTAGACLAIVWIGLGAWRTRSLDRRASDAPRWMQHELRL